MCPLLPEAVCDVFSNSSLCLHSLSKSSQIMCKSSWIFSDYSWKYYAKEELALFSNSSYLKCMQHSDAFHPVLGICLFCGAEALSRSVLSQPNSVRGGHMASVCSVSNEWPAIKCPVSKRCLVIRRSVPQCVYRIRIIHKHVPQYSQLKAHVAGVAISCTFIW